MRFSHYPNTIIVGLYFIFSSIQHYIMVIQLIMNQNDFRFHDLWEYRFFLTRDHTVCVYMSYCSLSDILMINVLDILPLMFILFLMKKTNRCWKVIVITLHALINGFFANVAIFNDRVAQWSTFTDSELFYATFRYSFCSLLLSSVLLALCCLRVIGKR
ncbi:MAG: hypothetical protein XXXJIFNMEKO3_01498 [Candidatus Erwinia impunctatus]|nr:hypothetical protein XXXJIFNMEKO_01498 [Culicoides impunctatus]